MDSASFGLEVVVHSLWNNDRETRMCLLLFHHRHLLLAQPVQPVHDLIDQPVGEGDLRIQLGGGRGVVEKRAQRVPIAGGIGEAGGVEAVEEGVSLRGGVAVVAESGVGVGEGLEPVDDEPRFDLGAVVQSRFRLDATGALERTYHFRVGDERLPYF